jgi:YbbR domain-containing protein
VLVSDPLAEVRVSVRGPFTRVNRLDEHDLDPVRIELAAHSDGDLRLTDDMVRLPPGMRVVSISPATVRLRFEPRVERSVPVLPVLEGLPAAGFRVVRSNATPKQVRASGARSVVEGIARAQTVPLRVADARGPVRGQVELVPPPPHAEWRTDGPITVEAEIEPALAERVLHGVAVRVTGASRVEARCEPDAAQVMLRGPAEALAAVGPGVPSLLVDAQAEDARPPGTFRKRISVVGLPAGIAAEVRPEAVTVVTRRRH